MPARRGIVPDDLKLRPYNPSPTGLKFHVSNKFFRGVRGPFGSGKSTMCVMEVLSRAMEQKPWNGVRRSRWVVLRNTYLDLISTTIKTWREWIPDAIAPLRESVPIRSNLNAKLADGTRVDLEVIFLSFDHPDDIRKLKSLEVTGGWMNEASELNVDCLDALTARVGRFPSSDEGGCNWRGIIADTNSPDDTNWWYRLAEIECPDGYQFFTQPPALIKIAGDTQKRQGPLDLGATPRYVPNDGSFNLPEAENIAHSDEGFNYYLRMIPGKSREWINVYLLNQYGSTRAGKVVYPEYVDALHCSETPLKPLPGLPLYIGWDFGLSVSCVMAQLTMQGQLRVLNELCGEEIGVERFIRDYFKPVITAKYPNYYMVMTGDPAGGQRAQTTEQTCFSILSDEGFECEAASTNDFLARRESVVWFLSRLASKGPALLIDSGCKMLRKGFLRTYAYRKLRQSTVTDFADKPNKNEYSHIHDALQYLCLYLRNMGYAVEKTPPKFPYQRGGELPVEVDANVVWE